MRQEGVCVVVEDDTASEVRWLAMLIRQACLMIAKGIERRYAIGEYRNQQ